MGVGNNLNSLSGNITNGLASPFGNFSINIKEQSAI
jgi:hypothetical protein